MTGTIYLYTDDKQEGKAAAEWTDLDNNRFFYDGAQQKNAPTASSAVGPVYKSIKNETGYILVAITSQNLGIEVYSGTTDKVDFSHVIFLCVLPNTTCSSTGQNWAIGLGVVLGVVIIVIIALFMSGVIVFHEGTGAGFGYNQR